ncbi:ribosome small subunit-dependent GTPase A [Methylomonas koyamae]|uniref:Small ribosomal subunit biogenesis GTPase RsgA n=1 Tax=Methylomonas koyamae TaxID=702114 RepID=A0A291IP58_9GAMM|nr:ribosome small subunit-dependent GTPase A [Methylomonas koyamae]ATG92010.1 ribosome small subunit-dependent GTPase A [Methylomonas koyamae]OAI25460.1 ribosome small subunit-dependent GTPase [Methylomonas koyamae]
MAELHQGLVVSHLGKGIAVEVGEQTALCQTLRKLDTVVVGDQVLLSLSGPEQGRIEQILPRRSVLQRPSRGDQVRPVAANLDTIFVVFAAEPECDFLLLDQYLAICENCNIDAALVFNKIDIPCSASVAAELKIYESLGYRVYRVSAKQHAGIEELKQILQGQTAMFAGQSGVGKSSLTNALLPDRTLRTNSVSATTRHGRHTTTAATLYHLPDGGDLIDSPGVAIFGLAGLSEAQLAWGYRDFQPYIGNCKFNDCRHAGDKDCAVRAAAESGAISVSRYQRFLKLREKMPPGNRL